MESATRRERATRRASKTPRAQGERPERGGGTDERGAARGKTGKVAAAPRETATKLPRALACWLGVACPRFVVRVGFARSVSSFFALELNFAFFASTLEVKSAFPQHAVASIAVAVFFLNAICCARKLRALVWHAGWFLDVVARGANVQVGPFFGFGATVWTCTRARSR